jgi:hypothetical protein
LLLSAAAAAALFGVRLDRGDFIGSPSALVAGAAAQAAIAVLAA